jgi:hypothetical protein
MGRTSLKVMSFEHSIKELLSANSSWFGDFRGLMSRLPTDIPKYKTVHPHVFSRMMLVGYLDF